MKASDKPMKDGKKTELFTLRLSMELKALIEAQAKEWSMSVADVIRANIIANNLPTISMELLDLVEKCRLASATQGLEAYFTAEEAEKFAKYLIEINDRNLKHYQEVKEATSFMLKLASIMYEERAKALEEVKLPNFENVDHENG